MAWAMAALGFGASVLAAALGLGAGERTTSPGTPLLDISRRQSSSWSVHVMMISPVFVASMFMFSNSGFVVVEGVASVTRASERGESFRVSTFHCEREKTRIMNTISRTRRVATRVVPIASAFGNPSDSLAALAFGAAVDARRAAPTAERTM